MAPRWPGRVPGHHHLGRKIGRAADDKFWQAVRQEEPEVLKSIKPWSKIFEPDPLRALLVECGVPNPEIEEEPGTHRLNAPEEWWQIIMGSGYRSTVDALAPSSREKVKAATVEAIRQEHIQDLRADVIYAIARGG